MNNNTLEILIGSAYTYASSWDFKKIDAAGHATVADFENKIQELATIAALHNTAVRLVLKSPEGNIIKTHDYMGERVQYWFGAYRCGSRQYIDQIFANVTYYEAMAITKDTETIALAETLDELQHLLGPDFGTFENLT